LKPDRQRELLEIRKQMYWRTWLLPEFWPTTMISKELQAEMREALEVEWV
jgi:hypothetical protein